MVRAEYRLGAGGLAVTVTARNLGTVAAPYGVGQHPCMTVGTDTVDEGVLTLPARRRGVAVEPVSCPPDAFRSGAGLVELGPGDLHTFRWGLRAWDEAK